MKNLPLDQIPAFFSNYSSILLALYVGLFGGLFILIAKIIRTKLGDFLRLGLAAVLYQIDRWFHTALARRFTLKQYCRLRLGDETTRNLLVPSANRDIKLDVDRSFVSLRLEHATGEMRWLDHESLLTIGQRIRVVGTPGSGKSSLVKRLLRDACALALRNPRRARLPVLLELRTLKSPPKYDDSKRLGEWLFKAVRDQASKAIAFNIGECVDAYVSGPGLLLLLDGLDEVASSDYPRMHQALLGLSQKLAAASEKNAIVLTMRTEFHKQVQKDFRVDFGHAVTVQPFSPSDIYLFLSRWPFDIATAQIQRNRIYKDLTDRASLREMCSNPLVLAMYVAQDQALGSGAAPESRTAFYKQVADELLYKRRSKQTGPSRVARSVGEQRGRILGKLALQHMLEPNEAANSLSWKNAIAVIKTDLKVDDAKAEEYFYDDLATETGLIVEVQERESFRFIHLTFCEFFAALEACNAAQDGWQQLLKQHRVIQHDASYKAKTRLAEVLPFACGLMLPGARAKALEQLAECADPSIVARAFLENKLYGHPHWAILVESCKNQLLATPKDKLDEEWLQNLHLFNVVTEDARQYKEALCGEITAPDMDEFFKNLVTRQRTSLGVLLHAYAKVDAAAVLRLAEMNHLDLANDFPDVVLNNCDQGPFFALLLEHALQDQARASAWACLFAEAGLRSQAVAEAMAAMLEQENWRSLAQAVPRQFSWLNTKLISNSFYTQCLTIANSSNQVRLSDLPVQRALFNVVAPSQAKIFFDGLWLPFITCWVCFIVWTGWAFNLSELRLDSAQQIFLYLWAVLTIFIGWKMKQYYTALMYQQEMCGLSQSSLSGFSGLTNFIGEQMVSYGIFANVFPQRQYLSRRLLAAIFDCCTFGIYFALFLKFSIAGESQNDVKLIWLALMIGLGQGWILTVVFMLIIRFALLMKLELTKTSLTTPIFVLMLALMLLFSFLPQGLMLIGQFSVQSKLNTDGLKAEMALGLLSGLGMGYVLISSGLLYARSYRNDKRRLALSPIHLARANIGAKH